MNWLPLLSFVVYTGVVGIYSWYKTRGTNMQSNEGYYLGGRSLGGLFIAGSLILTNLSGEQMVGLNGQSFATSMAVMGWEETAPVAMICLALIFLPRYLKSGIATIPDYLEERFDRGTRQLITVMLLLGYAAAYLPTVLYSGALVINTTFSINKLIGVSPITAVALIAACIGIIGLLYVVLGGLKAIAVSDTLNAIGLLVGGLTIPILGLILLGHGNFAEGIRIVIERTPQKLNPMGDNSSLLPWPTLFLGLFFNNLFYFCTNQAIVQRALGAKNLKEAQKGTLYAATFKLIDPLFLVLPGIIAFNLFGNSISQDLAYPSLVNMVLPKYLTGLFAAILFGATLSAFNGAVNSAVTLFTLDIYKPSIKPDATEKETVKVGRILAIVVVLLSVIIAPMISLMPSGLYYFLQSAYGFYNIPIIAIVLVAFFTKRVPAIAPKVALGLHIVLYAVLLISSPKVHFLYFLSVLMLVNILTMLVIGKIKPSQKVYVPRTRKVVDLTPWKYAKVYSGVLVIAMLGVYTLFFWISHRTVMVSLQFLPLMVLTIVCAVILLLLSPLYRFTFNKFPSISKAEVHSSDER